MSIDVEEYFEEDVFTIIYKTRNGEFYVATSPANGKIIVYPSEDLCLENFKAEYERLIEADRDDSPLLFDFSFSPAVCKVSSMDIITYLNGDYESVKILPDNDTLPIYGGCGIKLDPESIEPIWEKGSKPEVFVGPDAIH